ncbi:EamA family transporter [Nocardia sp. GCM10030253]|uniref:EamA family transporter n=1 Tax=Nocardia sp. GCM10030253 TaxID=3273404 RepID=UPI00363F5B6B
MVTIAARTFETYGRTTTSLHDIALTAIAPALFGTVYAATALLLPPDRPMLAAAMRALPAGLLILAFTRTLPRGTWWPKAIALATLNVGAFFPLLFVAAYRLPGGLAAAIGALQPLIVAALAFLILRTRTPHAMLLACLTAAAGVALMTMTAATTPDPIGVAAMIAATTILGLGIILGKKWGSPVPPLTMTGWQLTIGGLMLWPLTLVAEGVPSTVTAQNVLGFLYVGLVGTALAYTMWFRGVQRLAPTSLSQLSTINPLVAALAGLALLGQTFTPWQLTGFAITLIALIVGQSMNRNSK